VAVLHVHSLNFTFLRIEANNQQHIELEIASITNKEHAIDVTKVPKAGAVRKSCEKVSQRSTSTLPEFLPKHKDLNPNAHNTIASRTPQDAKTMNCSRTRLPTCLRPLMLQCNYTREREKSDILDYNMLQIEEFKTEGHDVTPLNPRVSHRQIC
jgi:hypothetical protein